MKTNNPLNNIHIANGYVLSGDLSNKATLTCGFSIKGITLENASNGYCHQVRNANKSLLQALSASGLRLQVTSSNSGSYKKELTDYYEDSKKGNEWSELQRNADFSRFDDLIQANLLMRKEVHFFITRDLDNQKNRKISAEGLDALLSAEAKAFEVPIQQLKQAIQIAGGKAEQLTDAQLFMRFDKVLNPSQNPYNEELALQRFNPENSISENCLNSDMMPADDADCGFYFDGKYHAILALKTLPNMTSSGIICQLSSLPIKDYSINLITTPLDLEKEISKLEDQISKLQKAVSSSNKARLHAPLQKCIERLDRLASGEVSPYQVQISILCWDSKTDELQSKVSALKSAILRLQGAQYYSVTNPLYARNFFLSHLLGAPVIEEAFNHETEDITVANLLPLSSTNDNSLTKAEAIYQTSQGGIFGLSVFTDQNGDPYIKHGLITGKTGFGKSASTIHFMSQLQPHTDHMFIIEDGGSYLGYASTFGASANSLILDKNGNSTLNYLSTNGLPLTHQHLSDTAIFAEMMIDKDEEHKISTSYLRKLLHEFYLEFSKKWVSKNQSRFRQAKSEYQLAKLAFKKDPAKNPNALISNQYSDFLEKRRQNPEKYEQLESELQQDSIEFHTEDMAQFTFAFMTEGEMPTHSDFYEWLCAKFPKPTSKQEVLLSSFQHWCATRGVNGCLFDGVSTFSFNQKNVHVELGRISEQDQRLKEMAGFIVANSIRNTITRMDRSKTKLIVFEEVGSFLKFQSAENIVADYYQRGRKYNASVFSIIQQITDIPTKLRNTILSNSSLALLFRQEDANNAEELQRAYKLPDSTTLALSTLPKPTKENGAAFISWQSGDDAPVIHSARVIVTPEMLYTTASDGASHERRQVALKKYDNVIEGIQIEAHKAI